MFSVVAINGSPKAASRTDALMAELLVVIAELLPAEAQTISLAKCGPQVLASLDRDTLPPAGRACLLAAEAADLLIIGTPVYRGSFTGILKHFLDLLAPGALRGKPAIIVSTGEDARHEHLIEQQLRPPLSIMGLRTLSPFIFASNDDFDALGMPAPAVMRNIVEAVEEASKSLQGIACKTLESFRHAARPNEVSAHGFGCGK